MIKISQPCVGEEEIASIRLAFETKYLGLGSKVKEFEKALQDFLNPENPPYVACVSTGTSALHLACQAIDLKDGDEVLVPTITYLASFHAITATGATPIAVDVQPDTGCICPADTLKRLSSKTKAIMPVHYGSHLGPIKEIYAIAKKHNLRVIEDAAHSFGGTVDGKKVGDEGDIICFSFDGVKNITCAEGGAVVTRDPNVFQRVSDLRLLGVFKDSEQRYAGKRSYDFDCVEQGWRYHMSNVNAAIGLAQLKKIDTFAKIRQNYFKLYTKTLNKHIGSPLPLDIENTIPHPYIFNLTNPGSLDPETMRSKRNLLMEKLLERGIESGLHYKPNHLVSFFKTHNTESLPVAEDLWSRMITFPLHCNLTEEDIIRVAQNANELYEEIFIKEKQ